MAIITAFIFAKLEIQIEGKHGWAEKLPTWKVYKSWFKFVPGGNKPLTGYHFYLWLLIFTYPHIVFMFTGWSIGKELLLLSFIILVLRLEDFFWGMFNPEYGLTKILSRDFRKNGAWWVNQWWGPLPSQYWISIIIWVTLFYLGLKTP